jgi:hypothetical protein
MTEQSDERSIPGFTEVQQRRTVELVEHTLATDDIESRLSDIAEALRLALEATRESYVQWHEQVETTCFSDEFALSRRQVEYLSPEWRLAYVARLIHTMALAYGVSTADSWGARGPGYPQPAGSPSIAGLVKGLVDIAEGLSVQIPSPPGADLSPEARELRFEMLRKAVYGHEESDE